jgi:hypothetical protein
MNQNSGLLYAPKKVYDESKNHQSLQGELELYGAK